MQVMSGWSSDRNNTELVATICMTVARVQRRDHSWFVLASDELGVQEPVLREYAAHGDDLSLAILIHVTRQQFSRFEFEPDFEQDSWPTGTFWKVLEAASKFNVQDTSPDLQHDFCILWNQIVLKAQSPNSQWMAAYILGPICNVYTGLHPETDSAAIGGLWDPFSFPSCNVPGHRPDSAPHVHDDSGPTTFAPTVPDDSAALVPASLASAESPFSSVPAPLQLHVDESFTDMLPLDDFHSESPRTPVTSPGPATAGTVRDIITLGKAVPHSASNSSVSPPTLSSTSPPAVFAIQHNDDLLVPSNGPNLPSSAAYNPVLDNRLPTGVPPSSLSPMTRPYFSPSSPESRRPIVVTAAPGASPGPTSDLGVATEDDDSQKPAITSPSMWETDAERTGDPPPHPSRGRYNIV
ncbi:hypothetical protein EDB84DRAFT_1518232 [Lactarius hengduanensis]|nr:hypothetical protein EDB84DRAFT_1518232 [Lactarius hengduanensis]